VSRAAHFIVRRQSTILALFAYCALSVAAFGRHVLGDPQGLVEGFGQSPAFYGRDQSFYVWSIASMAHALSHLENPLYTHAVFAPVGYNLTWAGSVLGPALLVSPVTFAAGAVASYNLAALAAPAIAALTAFLLCRDLVGRVYPAFAGGLLYGFGTYETVEMVNHLNLSLIALVPLAVLLARRRHSQAISRATYVGSLGALMALQLWTSSEVFASMVVFGSLAIVTVALVPPRSDVRKIAAETTLAMAFSLIFAAPYLYYALRYSNPVSGISGVNGGTDLLNLVVPTKVTWLHGSGRVAGFADGLRGNLTEQLAYFGLPLILLFVAYAVEFRRSATARCLSVFVVVTLVASLGAHVVIDGHTTSVATPWLLVSKLPLLRFALPARFVVYAWLALAIAVALWLGQSSRRFLRWVLFACVVASLAPNQTGVPWATKVDAPPLLREPTLARYVPDGSTVLALPFGIAGDSMFWQMEAEFRFRLAGGYVSVSVPGGYRHYVHLLRSMKGGPSPAAHTEPNLCQFVRFTGTSIVLLRDDAPGSWRTLLAPLEVRPRHAYGFFIYNLAGPEASHVRAAHARLAPTSNGGRC
jgi:hypothetical protein